MLDRVADVLRELLHRTPPDVADPRRAGWGEMLEAWRTLRAFRVLSLAERRDVVDLFTKSAGEILDRRFASDPVKAAFGFDAVVGNFASPYTPGSAYVLLHHVFGEVNGKRGTWGHARGGMGAITQAMARTCVERGVEIRTGAAVKRVLVKAGRACGVELEDGTVVEAKRVVANVNPKLLFTQLVDATHVDADFRARMEAWRCGSGTFRMNVALDRLPSFACLPGHERQPHHSSGIVIAPSLAYMERAYFDAKTEGWSRAPIVEVLIPSTVDDSLAPPGMHVASLFCQHVHPDVASVRPGTTWDDHRDTVADLMIDTVDAMAPGFRASVVGRRALTPLDLEREFGLVGGDIFHGALALDQLFATRPTLGAANYRMPVRGLYLCGVGRAPRRRRHRPARPQRRARDPQGREARAADRGARCVAAAAGLLRQLDVAVEGDVDAQPGAAQGHRHRERTVLVGDAMLGQRLRDGVLDLALRADADRLQELADRQVERFLVHGRLLKWRAADVAVRRARVSRSPPVSRVLLRRARARYGRHSSRPIVAGGLEPPTRGLGEPPVLPTYRPLLGVAPDGGCRVSPAPV